MFCPNCGKDCGGANFCVVCGARIQQELTVKQEKTIWSEGKSCPHCGGVGIEDGCCVYCGMRLLKKIQGQTVNGQNKRSLEDYYNQYRPSRIKAIKALRRDTGMGLVEAKNAIDEVFDKLSGKSPYRPARFKEKA